ncbi:MAG: ATP-binding protein [Lachnospiraceae bacterium]|nr:ATP-binding protein [Lachnospiraceae bacterium]
MKRKITSELNKYIESGASAPLLVLGPRGVGKTYAVCEWAESRRERSIYVNLETDASARLFFEQNSFDSIKDAVYAFLRLDEGTDPGDILLILDEIQACGSLCELFKAAYSPFGIKICCISSFARQSLILAFYCVFAAPMEFDEFLEVTGKEWYSELIKGHFEKKRPIPQLLHNELLEMWDDYLRIGGMPEAVLEYVADNDSVNIDERQRRCLRAVYDDILTYGDSRMKDVLDVLPEHMAIGRRRFTLNLIRRGVTSAMYRDAIETLNANRIVFKSSRLGHEDSFGLTLFDCGLAGYMLRSTHEIAVERLEYQQLCTYLAACFGQDHDLFYFESDTGAKADLLYKTEAGFVPAEFGTGRSRRGKSLSKIAEIYEIAYIVSVGRENYKLENEVLKIPMYSAFLLA